MKTVLFDIDGTLADIEHRRKFLEGGKKDWRAFNSAMGDDTPNTAVVELYKTLRSSGAYEIIVVTGRNEEYRKLTEQWFAWNEIPLGELLMRADRDNRADHIIKEEILDQLLARGKEIAFVVDDRNQVVEMWRRRGVTCLQCAYGDF